jgi:hypothetical protein
MDIRQTLVVHATFIQMLNQLKESHHTAALLFDDQGLTREEGLISQIVEDEKGTLVQLDNGRLIPLHSIVAVNGVFLSDYSEC